MIRPISFILSVALAVSISGGTLHADGGAGDRTTPFSSSSSKIPLHPIELALLTQEIILVHLIVLLAETNPFAIYAYLSHFPQGAVKKDAELSSGLSLFGGGGSIDPSDLVEENKIGTVFRSGNALVVSRGSPDGSSGASGTPGGSNITSVAERHANSGAQSAASADLGCKDTDKAESVRIANQDIIYEIEERGFKTVPENSELANTLKATPLIGDLFSDPIGEAFCFDGQLLVIVNPSILAQVE